MWIKLTPPTRILWIELYCDSVEILAEILDLVIVLVFKQKCVLDLVTF